MGTNADETVEGGERPSDAGPGSPWRIGAFVKDLEIKAKLGQGGMGAAFLVERGATGARYALKVLLADGDADATRRFVREGEAQAAAGGHPNVLRVREAGVHAGAPYLLLDLATGGSLADRLRQGPLPIAEAAAVVLGAARGVEHVHGRGVLHRDLKPANVMFDEAGAPLLVDFGLARLEGAGALTRTGSALGTPGYMAPEQTESSQAGIGPWTDVYGLGALLFAALTGRAPFVGSGPMQVIVQVLRDPVQPPSALRPEVPPALDAVCLKAMAKAPAARHASAAAFAAALEQALAPGAAPARGRGLLVALALLVVAPGLAALALPRSAPVSGVAPSASGDAAPEESASPPAGQPGAVTLDAPQTTHLATARVRLRASGPTRGLALRVGDRRVADIDATSLDLGVEVPLDVGPNPVRVTSDADDASGPARTVWRYTIPAGLEATEAPGEVRSRSDGSILVYHPPGHAEMGWNQPGLGSDGQDLAEGLEAIREVDPKEDRALALARYDNESPRHSISLQRGFFLGKHEVTWKEYREHAPPGSAPPPTHFVLEGETVDPNPTDRMPVYDVTWEQARRYCEHNGLRLPSELEWEYAARGGEERRLYPWGNAFPDDASDLANMKGSDDGCKYMSPVGDFPRGASRWGCLDLGGNVYEWTGDQKYRYTADPRDDPRANTDPERRASGAPLNLIETKDADREDELRFQTRGGAWDTPRCRARSAFRATDDTNNISEGDIGFRVARDANE